MRTPNLEDARELLDQMVAVESHTLEGQDRMANFIRDWLRANTRGKVRKVLYPTGAALADQLPHPSNVVAYYGEDPPDQVKENLLITGHFDTVPPHADYAKLGIDPFQLRILNPNQPHIVGGLGAGDMKGPLVAAMLAAKNFHHLPKNYGATLLFVSNEEYRSEGIHAAVDPSQDELEDVTAALSLEIKVGSKLGAPPVLLAGRPGRVELEVRMEGRSSHTGAVSAKHEKEYVFNGLSKALAVSRMIRLPEDPRDFPNTMIGNARRNIYSLFQRLYKPQDRELLMPRANIVPTFGRLDSPLGMSIADRAWFHLDVLYSNPSLSPEDIRRTVEEKLRSAIPYIRIEVNFDPKRLTPPTGPWREDVPGSTFIQNAYKIAREVLPEGDRLQITYGEPTADEANINYNRKRYIPTIALPPDMTGEHTEREAVNLESLVNVQARYVHALATHGAPISEEVTRPKTRVASEV